MELKFKRVGFVCLLLVLAGVPAFSAVIHRPGHRLAMQEIQQLEEAWREAQLAGDVPAMDRLLSEDFLGITASGSVVTKAQQLERMRTRKLVLRQLNVGDTKIKLIGSIAIVTSLATLEGNAEGEPLSGNYRYTRVYQQLANGNWKITSFEATHVPTASAVATGHGRNLAVAKR